MTFGLASVAHLNKRLKSRADLLTHSVVVVQQHIGLYSATFLNWMALPPLIKSCNKLQLTIFLLSKHHDGVSSQQIQTNDMPVRKLWMKQRRSGHGLVSNKNTHYSVTEDTRSGGQIMVSLALRVRTSSFVFVWVNA